METDGVSPQKFGGSDSPIGAALLLVIGEPVTDDHQNVILQEITKGFRCWDDEKTGININDELASIANRASLGEEGPNDERTIQHRSEKVAMEILVNPRLQTLQQALQTFLMMPASNRHLIYAGHYFGGSGAWVLQDDCFTVQQLARLCKDSDIDAALKQQDGAKMTLYCNTGGEWKSANISKLDVSKSLTLELNPEEKLSNIHGVLQFTAYIGNFIHAKTIQQLMRTSDVVGNIRFSKPTLYIFPACEGDSAMFGISGFNLLVNGGYSRKSCFWDFARHLDRIDAVLMTHLGMDNIFGISSVLRRKSTETVHPDIGFMYLNASDKAGTPGANGENNEEPTLAINLAEEGSKLLEFSKNLVPTPQPCGRVGATATLQPVNLYHKVGHGSLDMYILNPVSDSKELKDFYQQWNKQVMEFGTAQNVPLPNMLSICCLLVWQPADQDANINRLFFPGNAPQHKIIEGLEKLKHLKFLKKATCTSRDLEAKPVPKKPSGPANRPPSGKPAPKPAAEKKPEIKPAAKPATTSRSNKVSKEDENKKKAEDKVAKGRPLSNTTKPAPKSAKLDLSISKKPSSSVAPKKTSPTEIKKKPLSAQSPRQAAKKEMEKAPQGKQKSPSPRSPDKKPPAPVASVLPLSAPQPMETVKQPDEDVAPQLVAAQESLIDITPEEPQKNMMDTLVPKQPEESVKKSESPDPLPDPNQFEGAPNQGEHSLMYGSFHQDLQDDILAPQDVSSDLANGQDYDADLIQPESLPEPVAYSPQEPDILTDMSPVTKESLSSVDHHSPVDDTPAGPDVMSSYNDEVDVERSVEEPIEPVKPSESDPSCTEFATSKGDLDEDIQREDKEMSPVKDTNELHLQNTDEGEFVVKQEPLTPVDMISPVHLEQPPEHVEADVEIKHEPLSPSQMQTEEPQERADVSDDALDDVGNDDNDGDVSSDEVDSQGDVRDIVLPDDDAEEVLSPYAFENKAFTDGSFEDIQAEEASTEPVEDAESDDGQQCVDAFEKDRDVKESPMEDLEEDDEVQQDEGPLPGMEDQIVDDSLEVNQNGDYMEESNIPEAFEKDETPDPVEVESEDLGLAEEEEEECLHEPPPTCTDSFHSGDGYSSFIGLQNQPAESLNPFVGIPENSPQTRPTDQNEEFDPFSTIDNTKMDPGQIPNPFNCSGQPVDFAKTETNGETFDPKEWGEPMGLPAPPPPEVAANGPTKAKPGATKKPDSARLNRPKPADKQNDTSFSKSAKTNGVKPPTTKARPSSAAPASSDPKAKPAGKRPATATGTRASPASTKAPPLPPLTPFYMDLSYIPNHGNPQYSDVEFFKRVRARYYVLSSLSPNSQVLNALLDAKQTWEDKDMKVTIIPTYDNDTMRHWMGLNKDRLCDLNVDVAPSASRCTIQLQDYETSCSAFRLEF